MTDVNITKFVLINSLEKDHSMIETCCLKNVVILMPKSRNHFHIGLFQKKSKQVGLRAQNFHG